MSEVLNTKPQPPIPIKNINWFESNPQEGSMLDNIAVDDWYKIKMEKAREEKLKKRLKKIGNYIFIHPNKNNE